MRGEVAAKGLMQKLFGPFMARPPLPKPVEEIADGATLSIDGETVQAIHVPGHTGGSTAARSV